MGARCSVGATERVCTPLPFVVRAAGGPSGAGCDGSLELGRIRTTATGSKGGGVAEGCPGAESSLYPMAGLSRNVPRLVCQDAE